MRPTGPHGGELASRLNADEDNDGCCGSGDDDAGLWDGWREGAERSSDLPLVLEEGV